ncbi:MAG: hypothetical protein EXX96DRAFT_568166, partial [Benjaminiella poitrasii]
MNSNLENQTFIWTLENNDNENKDENTMNNYQNELLGLSDADLFQFLLGKEAQQAMTSGSSLTQEPSNSTNKKISKSQPPYAASTGISTSRLDFRPINDNITDSQLKLMTSKERRQLRNKISARNFRNRRKEYITSLEQELEQQKSDNNQLKLELKWMKAKMEKLQKENDKLRLNLMIGDMITPVTYPADMDNTIAPSTSLSPPALNMPSSDESTLSSTPSPPLFITDISDNWDFILHNDEEFISNNNYTYLSHALVPNWNISRILPEKASTMPQTVNSALFYQYPLLAPALMSIVLSHTMSMSTEEILATAKLSPTATIGYTNTNNNKLPYLLGISPIKDKEAKAAWDILQPLALLTERNETHASTEEKKDNIASSTTEPQQTETSGDDGESASAPNHSSHLCPINWIQQRVFRYLCEFAATYCTTTASVSSLDNSHKNNKFSLCRRFRSTVSC